jgi:polyvinyl alcohol dehydrogenase (cytochrome)
MFGQSVANNAAATTPGNSMSPSHIAKLKPKWALTTGGDVSARAAVVNGVVYFPDWGGNIWAVDSESGHVEWSHKLSDYGLAAGTAAPVQPL